MSEAEYTDMINDPHINVPQDEIPTYEQYVDRMHGGRGNIRDFKNLSAADQASLNTRISNSLANNAELDTEGLSTEAEAYASENLQSLKSGAMYEGGTPSRMARMMEGLGEFALVGLAMGETVALVELIYESAAAASRGEEYHPSDAIFRPGEGWTDDKTGEWDPLGSVVQITQFMGLKQHTTMKAHMMSPSPYGPAEKNPYSGKMERPYIDVTVGHDKWAYWKHNGWKAIIRPGTDGEGEFDSLYINVETGEVKEYAAGLPVVPEIKESDFTYYEMHQNGIVPVSSIYMKGFEDSGVLNKLGQLVDIIADAGRGSGKDKVVSGTLTPMDLLTWNAMDDRGQQPVLAPKSKYWRDPGCRRDTK